MANRYCDLTGSSKIKDQYNLIEEGFDLVESEQDARDVEQTAQDTRITNHVNGAAELHDDSDINNTSNATGTKVNNALNTLKSLIDAIVAGDSNASIGLYQINGSGSDTITGTYTDLTYFTDMFIIVTTDGTNETETPTFNLNSLGAKSIKTIDKDGTKYDLMPGAMPKKAWLMYDGTDMILLNGFGLEESALTTIYGEISDLLTTSYGGAFVSMVLKGLTLVNSVSNGDFSGGTTGWSAVASSGSVTSNIYTNTADGTQTYGFLQQSITPHPQIGDQYFIYCKARVTNSSAYSIAINRPRGASFSVLSPTINTWYELYDLFTVDADEGIIMRILQTYADAATANGKVMQIDGNGNAGVRAINMTALDIESLTEAQMLDLVRAGYFEGMADTQARKITSVNENLFDWWKSLNTYDGIVSKSNYLGRNAISWVQSSASDDDNLFAVSYKYNTQYTFKGYVASDDGSWPLAYIGVNYTDGTWGYNFISANQTYTELEFTTDSGKTVSKICGVSYSATSNIHIDIDTAKLEENSSATTYKAHNNSQALSNSVLRSVPAIGDKKNMLTGVKTQNVEQYTTVSAFYTQLDTGFADIDRIRVDESLLAGWKGGTAAIDGQTIIEGFIGEFYDPSTFSTDYEWMFTVSETDISLIVPKGEYADIAAVRTALTGKKINYQLATPVITQEAPAPIQSFNKGIILNEANSDTAGTPGILEVEYSKNKDSNIEGNSRAIELLHKRVQGVKESYSYYIDTTGLGSFTLSKMFEVDDNIEITAVRVASYGITGVDVSNTWRVRLYDSSPNTIADLTLTSNPTGVESLALDTDYTKIAAGGYCGFGVTKGAAVSDGQYNIIIEYIRRV